MNFIRRELPGGTIVVNFNPWLFSDEQHVLKSFFASITEALGAKGKSLKENLGGLLSDYGGAIGSITQLVGYGVDGIGKLGDKLKEISTEELKKRVDDLIIQSGKNIQLPLKIPKTSKMAHISLPSTSHCRKTMYPWSGSRASSMLPAKTGAR